ncbi:MAG: molybdopterin molybdenumtransferase MoeA, partial [Desulfovibrio sp.]
MRGFFKVQSVAQFTAILQGFLPLAHEEVDLVEVEGRILAQDLLSPEDLPQADRSVMDGFAVRAQDTFGSGESNPAYLELSADLDITVNPDQELQPGQCMAIVTGGCLPPGADAVVMIEHTADMGGGTMEIRKSVAPGDNIMEQGEDAQQGKLALAAGTLLRPQEIGFLAALGQERAVVHKQPRVGILSTGDELVEVGAEVRPGLVRDVNSHTLQALARRAGAKATRLGMVRDEESELRQALENALMEHDVVLLSGGSSVGVRDLTLDVIQSLDSPDTPVELLAHGVAVSPGKPLILARVGGKAVWGLPGQVTSAQVVMQV